MDVVLLNPMILCFVLGLMTVPLLKTLTKIIITQQKGKQQGKYSIYGLEHGILNIKTPIDNMWMNLGFWKDNPKDYDTACQALLEQVLKRAGIDKSQPHLSRRIIDLGFGCGDQTLLLTGRTRYPAQHSQFPSQKRLPYPIFDSYVGVTFNETQYRLSCQRINETFNGPQPDQAIDSSNIRLYHADAAKPYLWTSEIHTAIERRGTDDQKLTVRGEEIWILGLDCFYHFKPSRVPLFEYASSKIEASIMAFDMLLADNASSFDRLLLRLVAPFLSVPFTNFLSKEQYTKQLTRAGYNDERIEIYDISDHVFAGITSFLDMQDAHLRMVGSGIGRFRAAQLLFGWFARSGVVRACIIIARKR